MWRAVRDYLVYLVVRVLVSIVQAVRIETCHAASRVLARLACDVIQLRGEVVQQNLARAFPDSTAAQRRLLARRMWEHLLLMVCEIAHVPRKIHETNWRDYIDMPDLERLIHYLLDERATVMISGHFGNFEAAGYVAGLLGFPSFTIARPLDNPYLHDYINRFRAAHGQHILPKKGSASDVQRVLDGGGIITLLGDQHAGPKGCWVDFFGTPASCHKAIAVFTLISGAPMLVMSARRQDEPLRFEIRLAGVADPRQGLGELNNVRSLTQWYNRRLEQIIRSAPDQYWWVHRRWKQPPSRRRKPRRGDAASSTKSAA